MVPSLIDQLQDPAEDELAGAAIDVSATVRDVDRAALVTLGGELCASTCPDLVAVLDGLIGEGIQRLTLDLSRLRLCTSHGVAAIEDARARVAAFGGSLAVQHPTGVVRRVVEILELPLAAEPADR